MNYNKRLNSQLLKDFIDEQMVQRRWLHTKLRISESLLNRMMYEGHIPRRETLEKLSELIGKDIDELLIPHKGENCA